MPEFLAIRTGTLPLGWDARDCPAHDQDGKTTGKTKLTLTGFWVVPTNGLASLKRGKTFANLARHTN